jgi:hypothetical protein
VRWPVGAPAPRGDRCWKRGWLEVLGTDATATTGLRSLKEARLVGGCRRGLPALSSAELLETAVWSGGWLEVTGRQASLRPLLEARLVGGRLHVH